jgi:hypothetical protein
MAAAVCVRNDRLTGKGHKHRVYMLEREGAADQLADEAGQSNPPPQKKKGTGLSVCVCQCTHITYIHTQKAVIWELHEKKKQTEH